MGDEGLGAILGRAQLLKTFLPDPTLRRSVDIIERAALDGAATVRRIQDFSRTDVETSDAQGVLNGDLDPFIKAFLMQESVH